MSDTLFLIPARGGSKGIPGKNIKPIKGKPLILHSIDLARLFANDNDICISSEDPNILKTVRMYGMEVPFERPAYLANDKSSMDEVIEHSLNYYKSLGRNYKKLVLLQPTSPFRKKEHVAEALQIFNDKLDMVVSVKITSANPYYLLYEENSAGLLFKTKENESISRRQDAPVVYELNGAVYVINIESYRKYKSLRKLDKIKKILMDDISSIDLDTPIDWEYSEFLIDKGYIS